MCRTSCFSCVPKLTSPCRYLVFANCIMTLKDQSYYSLNTHSDLFLFVLGLVTPGKDKIQKEKENKGLFSKFRKSKKKSDQVTVVKQNFYLCALKCLFGNESKPLTLLKHICEVKGMFFCFSFPMVNVHCFWKRASYHILLGCLLFKANDCQCPSFSCACQQASTAQHGLTLLKFNSYRFFNLLRSAKEETCAPTADPHVSERSLRLRHPPENQL